MGCLSFVIQKQLYGGTFLPLGTQLYPAVVACVVLETLFFCIINTDEQNCILLRFTARYWDCWQLMILWSNWHPLVSTELLSICLLTLNCAPANSLYPEEHASVPLVCYLLPQNLLVLFWNWLLLAYFTILCFSQEKTVWKITLCHLSFWGPQS